MKYRLIILVPVLMMVILGVGVMQMTRPIAANPADVATLARANQLYENGQYAAASVLYKQLVEGGINNSAVFYNLGNTQMQIGQYDAAVESYVSAQALAPRDADITTNLALARQQAGTVAPDTAMWLAGVFSHNELSIGALLLWGAIAVVILALRRRFAPDIVKPLLAVLVFGFMVTGALFLGQVALERRLAVETTGSAAQVEDSTGSTSADTAAAAVDGGAPDVVSN